MTIFVEGKVGETGYYLVGGDIVQTESDQGGQYGRRDFGGVHHSQFAMWAGQDNGQD